MFLPRNLVEYPGFMAVLALRPHIRVTLARISVITGYLELQKHHEVRLEARYENPDAI